MTAKASQVLAAFESLLPDERQQVAAEILRRSAARGDVPDEALNELAAELFVAYDADEAANAKPSAR